MEHPLAGAASFGHRLRQDSNKLNGNIIIIAVQVAVVTLLLRPHCSKSAGRPLRRKRLEPLELFAKTGARSRRLACSKRPNSPVGQWSANKDKFTLD